jgi:hypothetical protein
MICDRTLIQNLFDQQKTGHSGLDPESGDCSQTLKKLADNPRTYGITMKYRNVNPIFHGNICL